MSKIEELAAAVVDTQMMIDEAVKAHRRYKAELEAEIEQEIIDQLSDKDYGAGTATINAGRYVIKAEVKKTIKWDQEGLSNLYHEITIGGGDPDEYMKTTHSVSEVDWKKWNPNIQEEFAPHRTVETSAVSLRVTTKE